MAGDTETNILLAAAGREAVVMRGLGGAKGTDKRFSIFLEDAVEDALGIGMLADLEGRELIAEIGRAHV